MVELQCGYRFVNSGHGTPGCVPEEDMLVLFQQWQDHQHNSVRLDKADADALWSRFSSARTTFNSARRKWAQGRDEERSNAKAAKEAIIAEAEEIKDSTAWVETSRKFNELMAPTKERPENKIDGVISMLMALGRALANEPNNIIEEGFVLL